MTTRNIVIIDDHPIVRAGIADVLRRRAGNTIVGEAADAREGLTLVERTRPDLVILDVTLKGGMNGIELLKRLKAAQPGLVVLVLSMHDEALYGERALAAGANGYLTKWDATERIDIAIDRVLAGHIYASEQLTDRLARGTKTRVTDSPVERLSDRELEVFELIGHGLGTREIADRLKLSVKTVETHRANIKTKLHIETAPQLVRHAVHWIEESGRSTMPLPAQPAVH